ncbi:MAG: dihydroxyacetone kinase subunit L [Hoeflea sp.]|nr:dihydroxyacetone kinase subunit L [Hoeflea sp.]
MGEMEIGMGIHGEPGVERIPAESADNVADRLLLPILEELDLRTGDKVGVLVNGLGSTTLLELYLLHRRVVELLNQRGVAIHASWVGEYCTSLDMEGASITLLKLDDDLQRWLDHPCETPALRVGAAPTGGAAMPRRKTVRSITSDRQKIDRNNLKTDGNISPETFRGLKKAGADAIFTESDRLSALDGEIGDGDHGVTMEIGWKAVMSSMTKSEDQATISELCEDIAEAFLEAVGASAGPLYAAAFQAAGKAVSDRLNLDAASMVAWLNGLHDGIVARGGASTGDKTMIDAWAPAISAAAVQLGNGGTTVECLSAAAEGARECADAAKGMISNRGRSKKLGQRSAGHVDPGAESAAVLLKAWSQAAPHLLLNRD